MLLAVFTFFLSVCAYQQLRSDAGFLVLDVPSISFPNLLLVMKNVGKEPTEEASLIEYTGYYPCGQNVLEDPRRVETAIPPLGPNQSTPPLFFDIPPKRVKQLQSDKCGKAVVAAKISWSGWLSKSHGYYCWHTFFHNDELEWDICDGQREWAIFERWNRIHEENQPRRIPPVL